MNDPLLPVREAQIVYAVFAAVRGGISHDWLAAYTSRERALAWINTQDAQLRECLVIWDIELDRHPTDPSWTTPQDVAGAARFVSRDQISAAAGTAPHIDSRQFRVDVDSVLDQGNRDQPAEARGVAAAFHALADLPVDAIPRDRVMLGTMLGSIAREAGGLTDAEAERFDRHSTALADLNERIDHLARLAAGIEYALVCGACGRAISRLASYVEQSPLSHPHAPGTCDVCSRTGSVSPSGEWIGLGA